MKHIENKLNENRNFLRIFVPLYNILLLKQQQTATEAFARRSAYVPLPRSRSLTLSYTVSQLLPAYLNQLQLCLPLSVSSCM